MTFRDRVALTAVLLLALVLRLGAPGLVEFKTDEANLSVLALDMVHGRGIPLLGIDSSVGIRNAPVSVYVLAVPYLFTTNPVVATAFIALLNVVAVGLLYWLARRYYGTLTALTAAILYAVAPWAVIFSRKIWAQDMLPPFILATISCSLLGFLEGKKWAQWCCLPLLAFTAQIHYGTFVLLPALTYLIWRSRRQLGRSFVVSLVVAAALFVPYLIGAAQAGIFSGQSLQKILTSGNKSRAAINLSPESFQLAAAAIDGRDLEMVAGPQKAADFLAAMPPAPVGLWLLVSFAAGWLVVRALRYRDPRTVVDVTVLLWLVATPLAFAVTWTRVYMHYMIPLLPAAFLTFGIALGDLWTTIRQPLRAVPFAGIGLVLALLVVTQFWTQVAMLNYVSSTATPDGFAPPLGAYWPVRQAILDRHPQNVLARLDGQYIGFHEETTVWNALLYGVPSVRFLDDATEVYPIEPALYLSHGCGPGAFRLRPGEPCYQIGTRGALDLSSYTLANPDGLVFANGAKIIAYRWESGCLSIVWLVTGPAPKEDFIFAVHFTNTAGQESANADALSWRGRYWRKGDTVVNRYCLKPEQFQGIAGVRLGMYLKEDTPDGIKFYSQDLYGPTGAVGQQLEIRFN